MDGAETAMLAAPWAATGAIACAVIVAAAVVARVHGFRLRASALAWAFPFAGISAFLAAWCALGLCRALPSEYCACQMTCAVAGMAVLLRDVLSRELASAAAALPAPARTVLAWLRDAALLAVASWYSFAALEAADNPGWTAIDPALRNQGLLIVALAVVCLYFLGQRRGALCVAVPVVCTVFGLVQNFLDLFKNTALLPSDVAAWQTAASVSGGYTYVLPAAAIGCLAYAAVALAALAFVAPLRAPSGASAGSPTGSLAGVEGAAGAEDAVGAPARKLAPTPAAASPADGTSPVPARRDRARRGRRFAGAAANFALCAVCACGLWFNVNAIDYQDELGISLDYWDLRNSYRENGFLVSFVAAAQDLRIAEPAGYSREAAEQLQANLARAYDAQAAGAPDNSSASFAQRKPHVVAIMNETYSDLSLFEGLHDGYDGTYVTRQLAGCVDKGWLAMSVHGGGTCNSEYEFLAESSMAFLGDGMYPYQQFSLSGPATLPSVFKSLGYRTWGIHPSYPGNWNRELAYADMGIDESLFVYDFEDPDLFHGLVSDRETYDRVLDILAQAEGPQFVLDVTIQNHSGYDTGTIPESQLLDVRTDFLDDQADDELDEYLSCIRESDEAIRYLLDRLSQMDEPVAVVFFGDHQPSFSRDMNDALFANEADLEHKARISKTPYFIWTNYDVGGVVGESARGAEGDAPAVAAMRANAPARPVGAESSERQADSETARDAALPAKPKEAAPAAQVSAEAQADAKEAPTAPNQQSLSSANFLGAQLMEAIGAPLDPYQKALLVLHRKLAAVNTNGYCDDQGVWHEASEGSAPDHPYHQLELLHYLNVTSNL